jgi:carboxyl-terminal processing protease
MQQNRKCNWRHPGRFSFRQSVQGLVLALLFSFSLPSLSLAAETPPDKEYFEIVKSIDLLGEVYREVSKNYVDTLNVSELMYAGIDGMLRTLDPYTVFLDEEDSGELDEQTNGHYVGVGITISSLDGTFFVTSVAAGHPAANAGIRVGDSIVAINNREVKNMSPEEVKTLIKGAVGTSIVFQLERHGVQPLTVTLVREEVRVNTVSYSAIIDGVGYLEMKSFGARSSAELREAFLLLSKQAQENHVPLKGVILDLRNNPGGLLNAAVDVASLFITQGSSVVSIQGRSAEVVKSYLTEAPPVDVAIPLVVLINSQSASAAEIVSGAIQDLDRGIIIGERSFGKGLVQSVIKISYDSALKLTIAKYYTPSGRLIQKEVKMADGKRKVLPKGHGEDASQVFMTKNGRKVYGSGGILPDILLSEPAPSPYLAALRKRGLPFFFSTDYCAAFPVNPPSLVDSKALMELFDDFLRNKKFVYTSDAERRFNELKESLAKSPPSSDDSSRLKSFTVLQQEIDRMKAQEIESASTDVLAALDVEIFRHYDDHLARKAELDHDLAVKKAVEVLSDAAKYSSALHTPVLVK